MASISNARFDTYDGNLDSLRKCKELLTSLKRKSGFSIGEIASTKSNIEKCLECANEYLSKTLIHISELPKHSTDYHLLQRQYEKIYRKSGKVSATLEKITDFIKKRESLQSIFEKTTQDSKLATINTSEKEILQCLARPFYFEGDNLIYAKVVLEHIRSMRDRSHEETIDSIGEASAYLTLSQEDQLNKTKEASTRAQNFIKEAVRSMPSTVKNLFFSELEQVAIAHNIPIGKDRSKLENDFLQYPALIKEACGILLKKITKPATSNNNNIAKEEIPPPHPQHQSMEEPLASLYLQIHNEALNLKQKLENSPPLDRQTPVKDFIERFKQTHPVFYNYLAKARTQAALQTPSIDSEVTSKKITPQDFKAKIGPNGWDKEYGIWHLGDDLAFFLDAVSKGIEELKKST